MNILVACNEKYLELSKYMLFSLRDHNVSLNVYLIHESLSNKSIQEIMTFFDVYSIGKLNVIKFDSSQISLPLKDDEITGHITKEAYFRLYAPFFLPDDMDRILYLDCDIICVDNILDFYSQDFGDNILCGCLNTDLSNSEYIERLQLPKDFIYINSGVLLFNLEKYKQFTNIDMLNKFIVSNAKILDFQDQDVINKLFYDKILYCDVKYNFQIGMLLYTEGGKLIHYTGPIKPWYNEYSRPMLARPYYDVLLKLGKVDELNAIKNRHIENFKRERKIASIIVYGHKVEDETIQKVLAQLDTRVEFIISYTAIDEKLIQKYEALDCRVTFVNNENMDNYYKSLTGLYYMYFNITDFEKMDRNFIREIVHFIDIEQLSLVFYKELGVYRNNKIVDFGKPISPLEAIELMNEKEEQGYGCIYLSNFDLNTNGKYGYWGDSV